MKAWLVGLVVVGFVLGRICVGAGWAEYRDGLLSAQFDATTVEQALEQTAWATGVEFSIDPKVEGVISRQLQDAPLEDGIRQLLDGYNYIMLFGQTADGERFVERVMVLGKIDESEVRRFRRPPPPASDERMASVVQPQAKTSELVLKRHSSGHYLSAGKINSVPVNFLVDTGATVVAISDDLARRIGLRFGARRTVETANGRTSGYETVLDRVAVGGLQLQRVRAVILPQMRTRGRVLLGMSFLEEFELLQSNGVLTIRQRSSGGR